MLEYNIITDLCDEILTDAYPLKVSTVGVIVGVIVAIVICVCCIGGVWRWQVMKRRAEEALS